MKYRGGVLFWPLLFVIAITVVALVVLEVYVRNTSQIPAVFDMETTSDGSKSVIAALDPLRTPTPRIVALEVPGAVFIAVPTPTRISQPGEVKEETYIVKPGDTLSGIATRYDVGMELIAKVNQITDPSLISVGQELIIPAE